MRTSISLIYVTILLLAQNITTGQSVGISNTGAVPNASAILDVKSSNKGVLLPRINLLNDNDSVTISHPALSLLVFNTNKNLSGGIGYYCWSGTQWDLVASSGNTYVKGKNKYTTVVDGDTREYFVHVPSGYTDTSAVPVVFMLHGKNQTGETFYNSVGWNDVGEENTFISVYPSSWHYCIMDNGQQFNSSRRWNVVPDADWTFCAGETPRDDIKFLKKILFDLKAKFKIDTSRIYLNGFSNGGQMAAKCAIEMSDVFAAVAENSGSFFKDTVYIPKRKLPVLYQVGNIDYGPGNSGPETPLSYLDSLLTTPSLLGGIHYGIARRHINDFGLDSNFTITGDTNTLMIASYSSPVGDTLNVFKYIYVNGLGHKYPNGDNHWMDAPHFHWAWMKNYRRL